MMDYPDAELTRKIIGAAFEVHNHLGAGFLEKVYRNALMVELKNQAIHAESEVKLPVQYKGCEVGEYYADVLVERQVIVELKALNALTTQHEAQLLNYLKATGLQVGLLLNFGTPRLQIKRRVF